MRIIILALSLFFSAALQAQRTCVPPPISGATAQVAGIISPASDKPVSGILKIPVVVHVLYQTDAQNISAAQIQSGIDALNRDFRRRNADTLNTPDRFKNRAADVEIEFALATADPAGRSTSGIVRKYTTVKEWPADDQIKFGANGGDDAWDAASYLNIWIGNVKRTLGYATEPGGDKSKDGIVITTTAFGTIGKSGAYNMGRTLVHETGHWLGLKHIWGDAACGDDNVADTPPQAGFTSGCPAIFLSSCTNGETGDMYMNYMDFTNDACMNLFTLGQKEKMRQQFSSGGHRYSLLQSKGLQEAWVADTLIAATPASPVVEKEALLLKVYPNPSSNYITVALTDEALVGGTLQILSVHGAIVQQQQINTSVQQVSVSSLQPGLYLVRLKKENSTSSTKFVKTL